MVTKTANPFLEHVAQVPSLYNGFKLREVNNIPQVVCPHCGRSHPTWDLEKNRAIKVDGRCERPGCDCPLDEASAPAFMVEMAKEGDDPALRELEMRLRGERETREAAADLFTQAEVDELVERTKEETREAVEEELTRPSAEADSAGETVKKKAKKDK